MLGLECQNCGAHLDLSPEQRTGRCLYCASPAVVERPPSPDRPNPGFALGFVVMPERALTVAERWTRSAWFAPESFRKAEVKEIRGIYVPAYLFTAVAYSEFRANIGERYTHRKLNGETMIKTEWRELRGRHAVYISDHVVTASKGLRNAELEGVEPFDLSALHRYTPKLISGWAAEEPSLLPAECMNLARHEAVLAMSPVLGRFMPGDRHTGLQHKTWFDREHLELVLLPVWVLPIRYHAQKPPVRLVINGQTGKLHGRAPVSWLKWTLLALAVLVPVLACVLAIVLGSIAKGP